MKNKQFEEWLEGSSTKPRAPIMIDCLDNGLEINIRATEYFYQLPFSMQWGVYLEFFDSVEIDIHVFGSRSDNRWYYEIRNDRNKSVESRQEAQQEAIKKAFEILEK